MLDLCFTYDAIRLFVNVYKRRIGCAKGFTAEDILNGDAFR